MKGRGDECQEVTSGQASLETTQNPQACNVYLALHSTGITGQMIMRLQGGHAQDMVDTQLRIMHPNFQSSSMFQLGLKS